MVVNVIFQMSAPLIVLSGQNEIGKHFFFHFNEPLLFKALLYKSINRSWEKNLANVCRSAYILKQESLPSSYKSFLNKHGGKDLVILQGMKDIASGMPFSDLQAIQRYYKSKGVDVQLDPNMEIP